MSIQEIASTLDIPVSSTAMHIRCLEEARMVVTESQPGLRGSMRVCINSVESIRIDVSMPEADRRSKSITFDMPVGNYYDFEVAPTCGLADKSGVIDTYDNPRAFYSLCGPTPSSCGFTRVLSNTVFPISRRLCR